MTIGHYWSCPIARDCSTVYPALFKLSVTSTVSIPNLRMNQGVIHVSYRDEVHERILVSALVVQLDCVTKIADQLKKSSVILMPFPVALFVFFRLSALDVIYFLGNNSAKLWLKRI